MGFHRKHVHIYFTPHSWVKRYIISMIQTMRSLLHVAFHISDRPWTRCHGAYVRFWPTLTAEAELSCVCAPCSAGCYHPAYFVQPEIACRCLSPHRAIAPFLLPFPFPQWIGFFLSFVEAMFPLTSWCPVLPLAVLLFISGPSCAHLADSPSQQHRRPSLVSDLRTAWSGLLAYSSSDLLLARDVFNITTTQSRSVHCTIGSSLTLPSSPVRGSSPSVSGLVPAPSSAGSSNSSVLPSSGLPSSIWKIQKNHVRTQSLSRDKGGSFPLFLF